ncbi:hypothetical protein [Nitrospira calida]
MESALRGVPGVSRAPAGAPGCPALRGPGRPGRRRGQAAASGSERGAHAGPRAPAPHTRRGPGPYEAAVQEARARLTAAREARRAARQAVREQLQPALAELRRAYDARLAALRRQVCQAPPDAPFPIYWTHVDDVFTRFLAACKRMAKGGGPPQPDTADPVRLRFLHRWTGGGLPISELALGAA